MASFHMHGVCRRCWGITTINIEHATNVPDGPTDLIPCILCGEMITFDVMPGLVDMDDDDAPCPCGWEAA